MLPRDISVPNNFWMSPIAIQLLKNLSSKQLVHRFECTFWSFACYFLRSFLFSKYNFKFKEMFECPPLQFSCWKSIIKAACTSIWVHFLIFFCYFFAVFKMIGREHQARLELPSFGFSKVRNPYAITDHPKMMLCYKAMCPSPLACTVCTGPLYIVLPKQILFKNMDILHLLHGLRTPNEGINQTNLKYLGRMWQTNN